MLMARDRIAPLLPHAGAMLLIDTVERWDRQQILCTSDHHRSADHPLRHADRLACIHAIEYAAQAAAIHGGLLGAGACAPLRVLGAIRDARFARDRLDDLEGRLWIEAACQLQDAQTAIYQARLSHRDVEVAAMRLTLVTLPHEGGRS